MGDYNKELHHEAHHDDIARLRKERDEFARQATLYLHELAQLAGADLQTAVRRIGDSVNVTEVRLRRLEKEIAGQTELGAS